MKKTIMLTALTSIVLLNYCTPGRKASGNQPQASTVNYEKDLQHIVATSCSPCHIPSKGGKKLALDSYDALKNNIGDIVSRIELHPGDKGFMPMKRERLSDSVINVFKQWQDNGMPAR